MRYTEDIQREDTLDRLVDEQVAQQSRGQAIKNIMTRRRQLEQRLEAQQLARETQEFEFDWLND